MRLRSPERLIYERIAQDEEATGLGEELGVEYPEEIHLYCFDEINGTERIIVITEKYTTYAELLVSLRNQDLINLGQPWIRHEDTTRNIWTPRGLYWERVEPSLDIDSTTPILKLNVIETRNNLHYTVAVLYDNTLHIEIPVSLEIAIGGGNCCSRRCVDTGTHLRELWKYTRSIINVFRISPDPRKRKSVLTTAFNDHHFQLGITELCIKCSPCSSTSSNVLPEVPAPSLRSETGILTPLPPCKPPGA